MLAIGFVVSGASMLAVEYRYASSVDRTPVTPLNDWAANLMPRHCILPETRSFLPPQTGPIENHSRIGHGVAAILLMSFLTAMSLRYSGWPLHPVGFLLVYSRGIELVWFSVLIGWLLKSVIVRLGGTRLYVAAKPAFIGLIIGETLAGAFWMIVAFVLAELNIEYVTVQTMPT
jgi:hypothetical protein